MFTCNRFSIIITFLALVFEKLQIKTFFFVFNLSVNIIKGILGKIWEIHFIVDFLIDSNRLINAKDKEKNDTIVNYNLSSL